MLNDFQRNLFYHNALKDSLDRIRKTVKWANSAAMPPYSNSSLIGPTQIKVLELGTGSGLLGMFAVRLGDTITLRDGSQQASHLVAVTPPHLHVQSVVVGVSSDMMTTIQVGQQR